LARLLDVQNGVRGDARLAAESGALYAIVDACDSPAVPPKVDELGESRAVSLYRGLPEEEFSSFAPYLLHADAAVVDWVADRLSSEPWGFFLSADVPLAALRSHFRRFLVVDDRQGERMYFRFYDPRVLKKVLPVLDASELREFFGPIDRFLVPDGEEVVSYRPMPLVMSQPSAGARPIGQRFAVREEVMAAFGDEADAAFEVRLIAHLREHHSDAVSGMSDALLLPLVRTGIARARRYGMTWESNLTAFVALMFEIAPNFDRHPRMQMILSSAQIAPETKLDVLMERTAEPAWQEVKRRSDPAGWREQQEGIG
jgi:hypothetical protein